MLSISQVQPTPSPDPGVGAFPSGDRTTPIPMSLEEQLRVLPARPGVYLFKDSRGHVLYVGKAGNLRSRTRAHFGPGGDLTAKEQRMQGKVTDVEVIVTDSEQHALIVECTLIKKYHPRYNVSLRDDKSFPYIKIDLAREWPRVQITRRWQKDGARYFGPFASAGSVRETVKLLKRLFPFCSCRKEITGRDDRACLEYYIHRCLGPCAGKASRQEYRDVLDQVVLFLEGRQEAVLRDLKRKMAAAAGGLQFERAAWLRDQVRAVQNVIEGQRLASAVRGNLDAIALALAGDQADVQVFFIRNSRLVGREHFAVDGVEGDSPAQILAGFVKQYYSSAPSIPPLILLQHVVEDLDVIEAWLGSERRGVVKLLAPKRGARRQLIEVVAENARQGVQLLQMKQDRDAAVTGTALLELKELMSLPSIPSRIEGYDISNIQGALATGSMVVFEDGAPRPSLYRRFRIKTVVGANDYAMLGEVLRRRFARARTGESTWSVLPGLILIDGGKGQLSAALLAMKESGFWLPVAGLAKEHEEVFLPGAVKPLSFPPASPARRLLQRVRDEAHRFALGYHVNLRQRQSIASVLDSVPGIGAKRRKALIRRFGSLRGVKAATLAELRQVPGINPDLAATIKDYLAQ